MSIPFSDSTKYFTGHTHSSGWLLTHTLWAWHFIVSQMGCYSSMIGSETWRSRGGVLLEMQLFPLDREKQRSPQPGTQFPRMVGCRLWSSPVLAKHGWLRKETSIASGSAAPSSQPTGWSRRSLGFSARGLKGRPNIPIAGNGFPGVESRGKCFFGGTAGWWFSPISSVERKHNRLSFLWLWALGWFFWMRGSSRVVCSACGFETVGPAAAFFSPTTEDRAVFIPFFFTTISGTLLVTRTSPASRVFPVRTLIAVSSSFGWVSLLLALGDYLGRDSAFFRHSSGCAVP